jgi:hypothetical protein
MISSYKLIYYWICGKYKEAYTCVAQIQVFYDDNDESPSNRHHKIYSQYILNLCIAWQDSKFLYLEKPDTEIETLHVIGESHSLSPNKAIFPWVGKQVQAKCYFVMGLKMWHLASAHQNYHKASFNIQLANIPQRSMLLVTVGEIDCRLDEGIWMASKKQAKNYSSVVTDTINGYLGYLDKSFSNKIFTNITLQGVPAPAYSVDELRSTGYVNEFLQMIRLVNELLCTGAKHRGWRFLDVHAATSNDEGVSNKQWHIDGHHLKPSFYAQSGQWLK